MKRGEEMAYLILTKQYLEAIWEFSSVLKALEISEIILMQLGERSWLCKIERTTADHRDYQRVENRGRTPAEAIDNTLGILKGVPAPSFEERTSPLPKSIRSFGQGNLRTVSDQKKVLCKFLRGDLIVGRAGSIKLNLYGMTFLEKFRSFMGLSLETGGWFDPLLLKIRRRRGIQRASLILRKVKVLSFHDLSLGTSDASFLIEGEVEINTEEIDAEEKGSDGVPNRTEPHQ
jgi:hypothetical protein